MCSLFNLATMKSIFMITSILTRNTYRQDCQNPPSLTPSCSVLHLEGSWRNSKNFLSPRSYDMVLPQTRSGFLTQLQKGHGRFPLRCNGGKREDDFRLNILTGWAREQSGDEFSDQVLQYPACLTKMLSPATSIPIGRVKINMFENYQAFEYENDTI